MLKNLSIRFKFFTAFGLALVLFAILSAVSVNSTEKLLDSLGWVTHTSNVIAEASQIESAAVDMETGARGYLLAGKDEFLEPYRNGEAEFTDKIAQLKKTVSDSPTQVKLLEEISAKITEWNVNAIQPAIDLRTEIGDAKTMNDMAKLVGEARGKTYFDKFRSQITRFIKGEKELIVERLNESDTAFARLNTAFETVRDSKSWIIHTYQVVGEAESLLSEAMNMETGLRGFLLAGNDEFLEPYELGKSAFFSKLSALQKKVSDNSVQVELLAEIGSTFSDWNKNVTEPAIMMRRQVGNGVGMEDIAASFEDAHSKTYFDRFKGQITAFVGRERELLAQRESEGKAALALKSAEMKRIKEASDWVNYTHDVIATAKEILTSAVDMETGMRGYLLAGKEEFLTPYHSGRENFERLTASLQEAVSEIPYQVQILEDMKDTINAWISDVTEPTIALRREIGDAKTMDDMADLISEARGKVYFDAFRKMITEFKDREAVLMAEREEVADSTASMTQAIILFGSIAIIVFTIVFAVLIVNAILRPITSTSNMLRDISAGEGDLSVRLEVTNRDELGRMAEYFNQFVSKLNNIIRQVADNTNELAQTSSSLAQNAASLTQSADSVNEDSSNTKQSVDVLKGNLTRISEGAEKVTSGVSTVAAAMEQMSATVTNVAENCMNSSKVSADAKRNVDSALETTTDLQSSASEISSFIETINSIADQTNLLALNATIEAASAGDAGKGFAVVASEVKELAQQTSKATDQISQLVAEMLRKTNAAAEANSSVSGLINQLDANVQDIAAAIEQQSIASNEISHSVSQASQEVTEISENINQATDSSVDVFQSVSNMNESSELSREHALQTNAQSEELSTMADTLSGLVGQFKTSKD